MPLAISGLRDSNWLVGPNTPLHRCKVRFLAVSPLHVVCTEPFVSLYGASRHFPPWVLPFAQARSTLRALLSPRGTAPRSSGGTGTRLRDFIPMYCVDPGAVARMRQCPCLGAMFVFIPVGSSLCHTCDPLSFIPYTRAMRRAPS